MPYATPRFLRAPLALSMMLAVTLSACSQKSKCITKGVDVEIASDHPHSATVPPGDIERGAAHSYAIQGDGHQHVFMLTADDMSRLQHGEPVQTRSTSTNAHAHEVAVRCKE